MTMTIITKYTATIVRFTNNNDRGTKYRPYLRENRFTKYDPRDLRLMTWMRGDFTN